MERWFAFSCLLILNTRLRAAKDTIDSAPGKLFILK
jgi:hypothetical protein